MKQITILGSYSGRNAGDAAILASIMDGLSRLRPEVTFAVPTTNPQFIQENYGKKYRVKPIAIMPWNLSLRLLGLPTLLSIARSDLVLITDGIIFDIKLFNPAFNFLITLVFLAPFARLLKKNLVCFCVGVGPLNTYWGRKFTRLIGNCCHWVTVREEDSYALMKSIGITAPMDIFADIAFTNIPLPLETGFPKQKGGLIGINITRYGGTWLKGKKGKVNRELLQNNLAQAIDQLIEKININIALITTQIMDIEFAAGILTRVKHQESIKLFTNEKYSNHQLMGLLGQLDLFAGMRLHSLILASAMGTPIVGLVYAPKVASMMKLLDLEQWQINLSQADAKTLFDTLHSAWQQRKEIKLQLEQKVAGLKEKAKQATRELAIKYL